MKESSLLIDVEINTPTAGNVPIFAMGLTYVDTAGNYPSVPIIADSNVLIDFGDGQRKIIKKGEPLAAMASHYYSIKHQYSAGTYNIKVYGKIPHIGDFVDMKHPYELHLCLPGNSVYSAIMETVYDDISYNRIFINPQLLKELVNKNATQGLTVHVAETTLNNLYPRDNLNGITFLGGSNYTNFYAGIIPRGLEDKLPRIYPAELYYTNDGRIGLPSKSDLPLCFDSTFAVDTIGPKLWGKVLGNWVNADETITYTYTTWPDKELKEVICTDKYSHYGLKLSFDNDTKTLSFINTVNREYSTSSLNTGYYYNVALKFIFTDGTFDTDYFMLHYNEHSCLLEGTPISVHNNLNIPIQDIHYNDLIKVYDFYRGKVCYQFPSFIDLEKYPVEFAKITFQDNSFIRMSGSHEFFNTKTNLHQKISVIDFKENRISMNDLEFVQIQPDNTLKNIKIKNVDVIEASAKSYSLYTAGTQTYFANNILCSSQNFNVFGQTKDFKIDRQRLNYVLNNTIATKEDFCNEFGNISSNVYYGQLQHLLYNGYKLGLVKDCQDVVDKQFGSYELSTKFGVANLWTKLEELPTIDGEEASYIALMDGDTVLYSELYKVGSVIDLPYNEKGWYCVADTKTYFDKYEVKTNTVLEKEI